MKNNIFECDFVINRDCTSDDLINYYYTQAISAFCSKAVECSGLLETKNLYSTIGNLDVDMCEQMKLPYNDSMLVTVTCEL
jgi:hypothetical protein